VVASLNTAEPARSIDPEEAATVVVPPPSFGPPEPLPRSAVWPLALALVVGLAVGFAFGYATGGRAGAELSVAASAAGLNSPEDRLLPVSPATGTAPPASAAAPPAGPVAGVAETEVKMTPAAEPAAPAPPPVVAENRPEPVNAARNRPEPVEGRLLIRSTPAGATAFVDGRRVGRTPVTLRDIDRGAHTVRVVHEGYAAGERRVTITAGRPSQSLTFSLSRMQAAAPVRSAADAPSPLTVESRPSGARVSVDGRVAGRTPLTLDAVTAGDHPVILELDGYRRWASSVRVVPGAPARVRASLER
jgi:hypothetical protein